MFHTGEDMHQGNVKECFPFNFFVIKGVRDSLFLILKNVSWLSAGILWESDHSLLMPVE